MMKQKRLEVIHGKESPCSGKARDITVAVNYCYLTLSLRFGFFTPSGKILLL